MIAAAPERDVKPLPFGRPDAGRDMAFGFPRLIAHAARAWTPGAGGIVGSGTVCNRDRRLGWSCIAEQRTIETLEAGESKTPFLGFGDRVRIEMPDPDGRSIFGAIDRKVVRHRRPSARLFVA